MNSEQSYHICLKYKLVFLGDISVGKTSIISRFIEDTYKDTYDASIGVDFASKILRFRGKYVKLHIWDTAGQEKYKSLIPSYVKGACIIYIVYDISNRDSFDNVLNWVDFVKRIENPSLFILIGNKIDRERSVSFEEAQRLALDNSLLYFEVSAKEDTNISKVFYTSASKLDCFDDIRHKYAAFEEELEYENKQLVHDSQVFQQISQTRDSDRIKVEPVDHKRKDEETRKRGCKC